MRVLPHALNCRELPVFIKQFIYTTCNLSADYRSNLRDYGFRGSLEQKIFVQTPVISL